MSDIELVKARRRIREMEIKLAEVRGNRDELTAQVHTIIADLDRGRANGTVYTYGNIQERLRNALGLAISAGLPAPVTELFPGTLAALGNLSLRRHGVEVTP